LRVSFAAFLIATVGWALVHPRKPAAGGRSATGSSTEPGTHLQAVLHRPAPGAEGRNAPT
ncbi:MAG TPA: hypothetical protein VFD73_02490, partial [Gemmatimonadales bacterium]|nr:hypothetical protein [Gemmatimonadales bacterium]